MLVLMRHDREEIVIPSLGVTIKVVDTRGGRVRIGIDAPPSVAIRRSELEPLSIVMTVAQSPVEALPAGDEEVAVVKAG